MDNNQPPADQVREALERVANGYDTRHLQADKALLRRLATEYPKLRADAERMNWLCINPSTNFSTAWRLWDAESSFRAAIDAAIDSGKEKL